MDCNTARRGQRSPALRRRTRSALPQCAGSITRLMRPAAPRGFGTAGRQAAGLRRGGHRRYIGPPVRAGRRRGPAGHHRERYGRWIRSSGRRRTRSWRCGGTTARVRNAGRAGAPAEGGEGSCVSWMRPVGRLAGAGPLRRGSPAGPTPLARPSRGDPALAHPGRAQGPLVRPPVPRRAHRTTAPAGPRSGASAPRRTPG